MFNLFKGTKFNWSEEGSKAQLEPVFENGEITSFIIIVSTKIEKALRRDINNIIPFRIAVENRIIGREFHDPRLQLADDYMMSTSSFIKNPNEVRSANRLLISANKNIIAEWSFDQVQ